MGVATEPGQELGDALRPLSAHSEELYRRCVAFVHDGTDPVVLQDLLTPRTPPLWNSWGAPDPRRSGGRTMRSNAY